MLCLARRALCMQGSKHTWRLLQEKAAYACNSMEQQAVDVALSALSAFRCRHVSRTSTTTPIWSARASYSERCGRHGKAGCSANHAACFTVGCGPCLIAFANMYVRARSKHMHVCKHLLTLTCYLLPAATAAADSYCSTVRTTSCRAFLMTLCSLPGL
jgi:hypothetical protein